MYSDTDLDAAVAAGALSADAAQALRDHVSSLRATPAADEEHFRLVTGFNDIFVTIAAILGLVGLGWIGGSVGPGVGGALVAAGSWGLAEYFTRQRRMALPSIVFLLTFVGGVFACAGLILGALADGAGDRAEALVIAASSAVAAGAAWLHWKRFMVPITVAAGVASLAGVVFGLLLAAIPALADWLTPIIFIVGLIIFAIAMWWDTSDRQRVTRRSDVAFWLHLLASPMIVHPIFIQLAGQDGGETWKALVVLALYATLGVISLLVDRRAILVSALAYVLVAIGGLLKQLGAIDLNVAITALIIGGTLLMLSAFWQGLRARLLTMIPTDWAERLPPANRTAPQPLHG